MLLLIVLTRKAAFTTCFLPGCIMLFDLSLERRKQTEMWLVYLYSETGRQVLERDLQPAAISTKSIGWQKRKLNISVVNKTCKVHKQLRQILTSLKNDTDLINGIITPSGLYIRHLKVCNKFSDM